MKSLWFERHLPLFVFAVVWLTLAFVPYDPFSTTERKLFAARTRQEAKTGLEDLTVYDQYKRK